MRSVVLLVVVLSIILIAGSASVRPIRIALSVDDHSFKDIAILINSVIESAVDPEDLVVHIVACGEDVLKANVLKRSIVTSLDSCFPTLKKEVAAFSLPPDSGFALQLAAAKRKTKMSHWNSMIGADMVRFYLASIFPSVDRLLYLDNDIIVSCCVEEVFDTPMGPDKVIGLALDSLQWATVTQFNYHYNASHPVVIKNMRRPALASAKASEAVSLTDAVTRDEFSKALPRYPNDGVLLIDVQKFNAAKILDALEEIAHANARGEYAVNLGTQQFTVLTMFDRWVELTPRANLRHFPDMARGYLMWFYYNGFIHYAGQAKPRALCAQGNYKDNWLRVASYTAWATSNAQVAQKCAHDHLVYAEPCVAHIPVVTKLVDLVALLARVSEVNRDETVEVVRVGPLHGDLTLQEYRSDVSTVFGGAAAGPTPDLIELLDRLVLHNSSWSYRNFDCPNVAACEGLLNKGVDTVLVSPGTAAAARADIERANAKAKKKGVELIPLVVPDNQLRFGGRRNFLVFKKTLCPSTDVAGVNSIAAAAAAAVNPPVVLNGCETLVDVLRAEGKKHWDVMGIVIDRHPPQAVGAEASGATAASSSSLGILLGLDLVFMRPRFIVVRLTAASEDLLAQQVRVASKYLSRSGFNVHQEAEGLCSPPAGAAAAAAGRAYACLWSTRLNTFEIATH